MGFMNHVLVQCAFLCLVSIVIVLKYTPNDALKLFALGCFFMLSLNLNLPSFQTHYRVIEKRDTWYVLRNGVNKYYSSGDGDLEFDAVYQFEGDIIPLESKNHFQSINRYQGTLNGEFTKQVKQPRLIHRFLQSAYKDYPILLDFIYKDSQHIFVSLALHFYAIEQLLIWSTRRVLTKEKRNALYRIIIGLYGYAFGFSLNCVRHLMRGVDLKPETKMLILLFMFPYAQFHLGFIIAYFPTLIQEISGPIPKKSFEVARLFLIHTLSGSVHILQMVLFKVWVILFAGVYLFMILRMNTLATTLLLGYDDFLSVTNRFELRGKIPLLVFGMCLVWKSNPKHYCIAYLSVVVFMMYFPFPRVMIVDVGQGDAIIITTAFNAHVTVIDTGRAFALSNLERALTSLSIRSIDQLIITHDDLDHNENQDYLMDVYDVKSLITQKQSTVHFLYELLGDVTYEESNENSLIFILQTKRLSFLFTGDAYIKQELDLLKHYPNLQVDVLKLGHHGSKTSTSELLVSTLRPTYAIASSNPTIYNHPHPDVMQLLHQYRISLLKTSDYGHITFIMSPLFDFVVSQRGHFGIIDTR